MKKFLKILGILIVLLVVLIVSVVLLTPWTDRWGATDAEVNATFPGDELVPASTSFVNRAATIQASPKQVYPWLLQLGADKGGLYSYNPKDLGAKGANAVIPFMLSLEQLGKASLIDDYWEVFLLFGAAIQMIDDWNDLEKDLAAGHYSYVTLGVPDIRATAPSQMAKTLRIDQTRVRGTYARSKEMIARSHAILNDLHDPFLVRLVDVTELRLDSYFCQELKLNGMT